MSASCGHTPISIRDQNDDPQFKRILYFALITNGGMFFLEIVMSYFGDSISLQADALDFFGDSVNYGLSLFVMGHALQLRARAALFKGATMGVFGLWIIGSAIERALEPSVPQASLMGVVGFLALLVNVSVAILLYRYKTGDSNMQSIWLCSRNDAIGNIAVIVAAMGVFATSTRWPDLIVAALIAGLSLSASVKVIKLALLEIRATRTQTE